MATSASPTVGGSTVEDHAFYQAHDKAANEMSAGSLTLSSSSTTEQQQAANSLKGIGIGEIGGLALNEKSATIYALHRGPNRFDGMQVIDGPAILAFNYAGGIKGALCRKTFTVPHGLSLDHKGMLWATEVKLHQIMRIDPNSKSADGSSMGRVTLTLGTRNSPGRGSTQFNKPTDVAVHPSTNEVYVADGYGNSRIIVLRMRASASGSGARMVRLTAGSMSLILSLSIAVATCTLPIGRIAEYRCLRAAPGATNRSGSLASPRRRSGRSSLVMCRRSRIIRCSTYLP